MNKMVDVEWISSLKVAELKDELKKRGLPVTGKKNDLANRLKEYEEEQGAKEEGDAEVVEKETENNTQGDDGATTEEERGVVEKKEPEELHKEENVDDNNKQEDNGEDLGRSKRIISSGGGLFKAAMSGIQREESAKKRSGDEEMEGQQRKKVKSDENGAEKGDEKDENEGDKDGDIDDGEEGPPPSRGLLVAGFLRPFTLLAARELMMKYGSLQAFWMPSIKDKAYVVFSTVEEASKCRKGLWKLQWPPSSTKVLEPQFVSVYEAEKAIALGSGNTEFTIARTEEDPKDPFGAEPVAAVQTNDPTMSKVVKTDANSLVSKSFGSEFIMTTAAPKIFWAPCKPYTGQQTAAN